MTRLGCVSGGVLELVFGVGVPVCFVACVAAVSVPNSVSVAVVRPVPVRVESGDAVAVLRGMYVSLLPSSS